MRIRCGPATCGVVTVMVKSLSECTSVPPATWVRPYPSDNTGGAAPSACASGVARVAAMVSAAAARAVLVRARHVVNGVLIGCPLRERTALAVGEGPAPAAGPRIGPA